jgi:hypothetical protein
MAKNFACPFCGYRTDSLASMFAHEKRRHSAAAAALLHKSGDTALAGADFDDVSDLPFPEATKYYEVRLHRNILTKKFGTRYVDFQLFFRNLEDNEDDFFLRKIMKILYETMSNIMTVVTRHSAPRDKIRVVFRSPDLDPPVSIPFVETRLASAILMMSRIETVLMSKKEFSLTSLNVNVVTQSLSATSEAVGLTPPTSLPLMGGKRIGGVQNRKELNFLKFAKLKRSLITIPLNRRNTCVATAILLAIALNELPKNKKKIRPTDYIATEIFREKILSFYKDCGVYFGRKIGYPELEKFQNHRYLKNRYEIHVYSSATLGKRVARFGNLRKDSYKIPLLIHGNHVWLINSGGVAAMRGHRSYCYTCDWSGKIHSK